MSSAPRFQQPKQPWDWSMWSVVAAVAIAIALALAIGTRAGALCFAGYLAFAAVARALGPARGPSAFTVRAKWFDVTALGMFAFVMGALGLLAPPA